MQNSIRTRRYELSKLETFRFLEQKSDKSTLGWFSLGWILHFFDEKMMIFCWKQHLYFSKCVQTFTICSTHELNMLVEYGVDLTTTIMFFHRYFLLKPDFLTRSTFLRPEVQKCWEMGKSCKIEKIMIFQILIEIFTNKFALAPSKPVLSILSKTSLGT